jgi:apolipoprotein N-acyltransferase
MRFLDVGVSPRQGCAAVALALAGAAAFPPLGVWPLTLISIAGLLYLLRDRPWRDALNLGVVYGFVYGLGTMYWFFGLFGTLAISLVALMAGYFGLLAALVGASRGHSPLARAALVAGFAVGIEWLRGDAWYLRFPWYTPAHALAAAPAWIAGARWVGAYGLSFLIWFVAAWGAFDRLLVWAAFLLLPLVALTLRPLEPVESRQRALLVQAEETTRVERLLSDVPAGDIDLAVLPEYAYFSAPAGASTSQRGPGALARRLHGPVVFGAVEGTYGEPKFENVAAVLGPDGTLIGSFTKQHPVPLFLDGTPGTSRPVFPVDGGTLGVAICYDFDAPEIAASLVRSGATVLVAPTFDAMPWGRVQHVNHELLLRLRAVENDRWILRAASSGRSEAIDPHGHPSAEGVEIGETGFTFVSFAHRMNMTPAIYLAWFGPACAAVSVAFLVLGRLRRARSKSGPGTQVMPTLAGGTA